MKYFIVSFLLVAFVFPAQGIYAQETSTEDIIEAETITNADLEVAEPGLLPTSPFYFFKEIGRGLERALTFDPVNKAELELRIASEKAAEAKKVEEQDPNNERGIERALVNFERGQERLRERLSRLSENSENPNIDALFDKIAERTVVHEKLLEGIETRQDGQKANIQDIRTRIQGTFAEIAQTDTPERFQKRLQDAFESGRGSSLKHLRSVEILDRLRESDQVPDNVKDRLQELRDNFSERARSNIELFANEGEEGANRLRDALGRVPGDAVSRSVVLEEIRARASDRAAGALSEARDSLDERIADTDNLPERVKNQITEAESKLDRIKNMLRESDREIPEGIQRLVNQAEEQLEKAKAALREGNAREAFGLARAAEAIIANILRLIEQGVDTVRDAPQLLDRVQDRVRTLPAPIKPQGGFNNNQSAIVPDSGSGPTKIQRPNVINQNTLTPQADPAPAPTAVTPTVQTFSIKADDNILSPSTIRVQKGSKVVITFHVSETNVYFGGLDFRSDRFKTDRIDPGGTTTVEFTADESFDFTSYWPASNVQKATGRVIVE